MFSKKYMSGRTKNMIVGRLTYDTVKQRHKALGELSTTRVPQSSEFMSKNLINERP